MKKQKEQEKKDREERVEMNAKKGAGGAEKVGSRVAREKAVVDKEMQVIEDKRKLAKANQELAELKMGCKSSQQSFCHKKPNQLLNPSRNPGPMR
ncbi:unnamed protein product [Allacma fusca]|uniref:Uncharacterized protein n=1 Tax=Allacma fusca TaxID=39272 RepID=A0A8J2J939_9HEXA|nr:unnamed protein product [Allacma fusca]